MSKRKKQTRKGQAKASRDININDFANSAAFKCGLKKPNTSVPTISKQSEGQPMKLISWDDQDFDHNYNYIKGGSNDGKIVYVHEKIKETSLQSESTDLQHISNNVGIDYPVDIWYIISEYIKPEDIGTFSTICRTSYGVVNTGRFWFSLYKRYYRWVNGIPHYLHPKYINRLYGIRTLVIKSLYYMYPPFLNRLKDIKVEEHPDVLTKRVCEIMWYQQLKDGWVYYFKLRKIEYPKYSHSIVENCDLLDRLGDITANSEENCRMLQIKCLNFIHLEPVLGLFLTSAGVTLSRGFRHNRVHLIFNTNMMHGKSSEGAVNIVIDPVTKLKILDWWHPLYPHNYSLKLLVNK